MGCEWTSLFAAAEASASSGGLGPLPAAEASAAEQLTWLKERCVEHSGKEGWEETAQGVARALLAADSKSDDEVAAELFDLLGDGGVELIMGAIERRASVNAALRRRIAALRDTLGGRDDDDGDGGGGGGRGGGGGGGKMSGGSGAPGPTVSITSTTDQKLEKLRRKEERKVGRRIAQGQGEPLLEWLAVSGVGFAAICEGDWEKVAAAEKAAAAASEAETDAHYSHHHRLQWQKTFTRRHHTCFKGASHHQNI